LTFGVSSASRGAAQAKHLKPLANLTLPAPASENKDVHVVICDPAVRGASMAMGSFLPGRSVPIGTKQCRVVGPLAAVEGWTDGRLWPANRRPPASRKAYLPSIVGLFSARTIAHLCRENNGQPGGARQGTREVASRRTDPSAGSSRLPERATELEIPVRRPAGARAGRAKRGARPRGRFRFSPTPVAVLGGDRR
jgi:hypothetical protein